MAKNTIYPGATLGILGGGQLGRMIVLEGKKMGYRVVCLDPQKGSPCGQVADEEIIGSLDDLNAARQLAEKSDVLIYEFENLDVGVVKSLEEEYCLPQGSSLLGISQNRRIEKESIQEAGFPVAPFEIINHPDDLDTAVDRLALPAVLKTTTGGYDGKGQMVIRTTHDLAEAKMLVSQAGIQWVLEKMINFTHEISVIVARDQEGESLVYPVGENIHRDNILHMTIVPARVDTHFQEEAQTIAKGIAEAFKLVGLLVIEFFVTEQGVIVNEMAPRPHNSGHYSFDVCYTSQFEQLIRAVCGLPLGSVEIFSEAVMVNILGENLSKVVNGIPSFPENVKVHLYGKTGDPEPKRKVGHVTIKTTDVDETITWALENLV